MTSAPETKLATPPGYTQLVPFDKVAHRNLGLKKDQPFKFAAPLNAVYLSCVEFLQAVRHFPIVFAKTGDGADIVPMAVTGLKNGQNLFVDNQGSWPDGVYIPAYLRRYPFYTAYIQNNNVADEHMICVDPAGLVNNKTPILDSDGNTTKEWTQLEKFIREMELAAKQTQRFTQTLSKHELLETFEAKIHGAAGNEFHLSGMLKVSEEKLKGLTCKILKELMNSDYLFLIQMHRMSLDNFRLLLNRAGAKPNRKV